MRLCDRSTNDFDVLIEHLWLFACIVAREDNSSNRPVSLPWLRSLDPCPCISIYIPL